MNVNTNLHSLEDDFVFILPQMRSAKGPIGTERRRLLVSQAISGRGKGAPQVMLKITSFSGSAEKLAMHVDYIIRNGENTVFDRDGNRLAQFSDSASASSRREAAQLYTREMVTDQEPKTKKMGRPRKRVSMNLMLSMPAGTDKKGFELAVADFLNQAYDNFDYLYTFHDDREHYHAHVVVGLQGRDGRWLNPRKNDLSQWRQGFASSLQRRGIGARATPSYSQGKRKSGYRRDLHELGKRGARRVARPAPTYDSAKEDAAIAERREAWTRVAAHYEAAGETDLADGIATYVAQHFDSRHGPERTPSPRGRGGRGR